MIIVIALTGGIYFIYLNQNSTEEETITPASLIGQEIDAIAEERRERQENQLNELGL